MMPVNKHTILWEAWLLCVRIAAMVQNAFAIANPAFDIGLIPSIWHLSWRMTSAVSNGIGINGKTEENPLEHQKSSGQVRT
jgi:hypothetical protein